MGTAQYARIRAGPSILLVVIVFALASSAVGFTWPWETGFGWPRSSSQPVIPLDRPSVDETARARGVRLEDGFHFAVWGDQRPLADGEWQDLLHRVKDLAAADEKLVFLVDTGDIVQDGRYSDQFARLHELLSLGPPLPYFVSAGNHELRENAPGPARANLARFLSQIDRSLGRGRLYYRKDAGRVRFLFLDSNDLVYGDNGSALGQTAPLPGSRAEAQMDWLVAELAISKARGERRIVVMHHPIVTSSAKHREQARDLWRYRFEGRSFPEILADGGVDLVITGHTHTYERFLLRRADGRELQIVNLSGRPRDSILWFGGSAREAHDLRGREKATFAAEGWTDLERWEVSQEDVMVGGGSNQFGVFRVMADGGLFLEVFFLEPEKVGEIASRGAVQIF